MAVIKLFLYSIVFVISFVFSLLRHVLADLWKALLTAFQWGAKGKSAGAVGMRALATGATSPHSVSTANAFTPAAPLGEGVRGEFPPSDVEPEQTVLVSPEAPTSNTPQASAQTGKSSDVPLSSGSNVAPAPRKARRPKHENRWVGALVQHGVGQFTDTKTHREYSSYYVRIDADDGSIVTKRGVELEQAIAYANVKPGDRVELLFLGREAVSVDERGQAARKFRNRWRINHIR